MNVSSRPVLAGVAAALAVAVAELVLTTATGAHARSGWTVTTQVTVRGGTVDPPDSTATPATGDPAGKRERTTEPSQPANPTAAPIPSAGSPAPVEHADAGPAPAGPPPGPPPDSPPDPPRGEPALPEATPAGGTTEAASGNDP
jgi:hypothetical protein